MPVHNHILIAVDLKDTKESEGGLVLNTDIKFRNAFKKNNGIILKVGENAFNHLRDNIPSEGDEVYFTEHSGDGIEDGDVMYRIIQDIDIFALNKKKEQ
jgi:co-chaperonin GroES (HSP10)